LPNESNDPKKQGGRRHGKFILIRRDAYDDMAGHASIAAMFWKMLRFAARGKRQPATAYGSAAGRECARSVVPLFFAMWEAGKKNLYSIMGGKQKVYGGIARAL